MKKRGLFHVVVFSSGLVFALGLGIAGMGRPEKILAFLDVAGLWDPSLALVMAGALAVHGAFVWTTRSMRAPLLAPTFVRSTRGGHIDRSLVVGSVLFGVGWGLVGYCPGPAIVALADHAWTPALFSLAMIVGLWLPGRRIRRPLERSSHESMTENASRG